MSVASEASQVNLDFLINELGLQQVSNTSVFRKGNIFVISPSVQNKSNTFELGESLMKKFNPETDDGYLLIRLKEKFLMCKLHPFQRKMMTSDTEKSTKSKPSFWKFHVIESIIPRIENSGDRELTFKIQAPTNKQLISFFNKETL
ncbi:MULTISPECIES: hypothetical protein [unclassified Psychrobacillus]|uniref:hypothetical protein n=1 Tax=unclassified Psychrobacillus TaxID=2636677 RepID=UPI00146AB529|nr:MULTISPECIES: hypothetical protein [unclassified Psychrobacillus]MCM3357976.1 hypothetical protein [Psychrobacillus sp. MER TA 171]NME05351.1 hypothetical protein [Psychrobacillus sp. BL-248-WT-3]